jgi:hypothetical protein
MCEFLCLAPQIGLWEGYRECSEHISQYLKLQKKQHPEESQNCSRSQNFFWEGKKDPLTNGQSHERGATTTALKLPRHLPRHRLRRGVVNRPYLSCVSRHRRHHGAPSPALSRSYSAGEEPPDCIFLPPLEARGPLQDLSVRRASFHEWLAEVPTVTASISVLVSSLPRTMFPMAAAIPPRCCCKT